MCEVPSYTKLMSNGPILTLVLGLVISKFPWAKAQGKWTYGRTPYNIHNIPNLNLKYVIANLALIVRALG